MTGFKNRFITLLQWLITYVGNSRSERTLTFQQVIARVAIQEAGGERFVARLASEEPPKRAADEQT
jgi:hypothetical protein